MKKKTKTQPLLDECFQFRMGAVDTAKECYDSYMDDSFELVDRILDHAFHLRNLPNCLEHRVKLVEAAKAIREQRNRIRDIRIDSIVL